jgi:gliding motility-associated protein GldE
LETDSFHLLTFCTVYQPTDLTAHTVSPIAIVVLLLLLTSLFFVSAAQAAFFALTQTELDEAKKSLSFTDKLILKNLDKPERLLASLLTAEYFFIICITLLIGYTVNQLMPSASQLVQITVDVLASALVNYLAGNLFPKITAAHHPLAIARAMAIPALQLSKLTWPLRKITVSSSWVANHQAVHKNKAFSIDELSQALERSHTDLNEEKEIIEGIINFSSLDVSEIMTPRVDVIDVDINTDFDKVLALIVESGYSRIPVFEDSSDNIKGILYVKDLLVYLNRKETIEWQKLIRKAYFIPETKKINDLLTEFQARKLHMAIVVDEYGGTAGIVTLEDIIEEIVGDISDEMDHEETANFHRQPDGSYIFEGKIPMDEFYEITGVDIHAFEAFEQDIETLAGLLLEIDGMIPRKGDVITYNNYKFTVIAADNRRIKKIKFHQPATT